MTLQLPNSMEECVYFTRRAVGDGKVVAWVFKEDCPECGKAKMGKPVDPKTGKAKIRATEYVCPSCKHTEPKKEYEEKLFCNVQYTCPHCKKEGEQQVPFKRKKFQGVDAVVFNCDSCGEKIPISKKMADPKKKKKK